MRNTISLVICLSSFSFVSSNEAYLVPRSKAEESLRNISYVTEEPTARGCAAEEYVYGDTSFFEPQKYRYLVSIEKNIDMTVAIFSTLGIKSVEGNVAKSLCDILKGFSDAIATRMIIEKGNFYQAVQMSREQCGSHEISYEILPHSTVRSQPWFKQINENPRVKRWTPAYFHCKAGKWISTYISYKDAIKTKSTIALHLDVDLSRWDINQCNHSEEIDSAYTIRYFEGTNKCHQESSLCIFESGHGWKRGGYTCVCKDGYYSRTNSSFNGSLVEVTWENYGSTDTYPYLYVCLKCEPGCETCTDGRPCMAAYNWPFRIALLAISVVCIFFTFIVMLLVYHMKSLKVFKMASPVFLQICLVGCIIMYLEMAVIFPILNTTYCVLTKWFRHMGFCLTFSSLVMKTWRVSLTYRVKSAHKIKLTDKQLLQWMTPIILIMAIYLSSWTIRDPPEGEDFPEDNSSLTFKRCSYTYWDHSIALGEMIFLIWGSKVCWGVRKAESFFDEAKCITWAVYNITAVNVTMASFHVFIFANAGPDTKYFFGFLRTQLSTTVTIALVFGPKFLRVLRGKGNELDAGTGMASFPVNGAVYGGDEIPDPLEENEELKEEIQKLAAQIEFMKIVNMEINNRHLKPRAGSYFTDKGCLLPANGQSPSMTKNSFSKFEALSPVTTAQNAEIIDDEI